MFYEPTSAMDPHAWHDAWPPVLDAVREAMDVPGLPPADRAALARIYETAEPFAGRNVIRPPASGPRRRRTLPELLKSVQGGHEVEVDGAALGQRIEQDAAIVEGPGGIQELVPHLGARHVQIYHLLYRAGVLTVDEVRRMSDADLLKLDRIGPVRLSALRAALAAYAAQAEVIA